MSPSTYILLFYVFDSMLYVYVPQGVIQSMLCFNNMTNITLNENCHFMSYERINNNNLAFSHKFTVKEKHSKYFKVLYYYPNNTIVDTNWFNNTEKQNGIFNKQNQNLDNQNLENKNMCNIFGILNLVLSMLIFIFLTAFFYFYYTHFIN